MTTSLIHLGLAKTATTYLQKSVFPQATGVNYLGKPFRSPARAVLRSVAQKRWEPPLNQFLNAEARLRSEEPGGCGFVRLQVQLHRALSPRKLNIWSHEGLLRPTRDDAPLHRVRALQNLRNVFDAAGSSEIHALLVLRGTRRLMMSYARQFLHELEARGLEECDPDALYLARSGAGTGSPAEQLWRLWYSYFDFGALVADLTMVFGASYVHVMNYDDLAEDWANFQAVVSTIHPEAQLHFPDARVNDSLAKPADTTPRFARHMQMIETLDLTRLYPDNDRYLDLASPGAAPR